MSQNSEKVLIIAEVGVNHNGDMQLAKEIIDSVAPTDVDVIKFQTVNPELLMVSSTPKADYQKETTGADQSAFEMIKNLQFSFDDFVELKAYVEAAGKIFLSTAFDHPSLSFLSELGLKLFKIPSGEITNLPYLRDVASRAEKIILSTGMSEIFEVQEALDAITSSGFPRENIIVLQCNTAYPTPIADTNLRAMVAMGNRLNVAVGFSDHTEGIAAAVAAVALGAKVIEKHVTVDKSLPGPDQHASMEPGEFAFMVKTIREVEQSLGSDQKSVSTSEKMNIPIARRGMYASRDIPAGKVLTSEDLIALRPQAIISPMDYDLVINSKATRNFAKHEPITFDGISSE